MTFIKEKIMIKTSKCAKKVDKTKKKHVKKVVKKSIKKRQVMKNSKFHNIGKKWIQL